MISEALLPIPILPLPLHLPLPLSLLPPSPSLPPSLSTSLPPSLSLTPSPSLLLHHSGLYEDTWKELSTDMQFLSTACVFFPGRSLGHVFQSQCHVLVLVLVLVLIFKFEFKFKFRRRFLSVWCALQAMLVPGAVWPGFQIQIQVNFVRSNSSSGDS